MGGGARAVTKGAQKVGERLAERAPAPAPDQVPTADGVQVNEVAPAEAGIEEITIDALPPEERVTQQRVSLMEEMDMDLPGFTQEEIDARDLWWISW